MIYCYWLIVLGDEVEEDWSSDLKEMAAFCQEDNPLWEDPNGSSIVHLLIRAALNPKLEQITKELK